MSIPELGDVLSISFRKTWGKPFKPDGSTESTTQRQVIKPNVGEVVFHGLTDCTVSGLVAVCPRNTAMWRDMIMLYEKIPTKVGGFILLDL